MKKSFYLLLSLVLLTLSYQASARDTMLHGGDSSGGGRGVFCQDSQSPHHGRLLDLYESYALWHQTPIKPVLTFDQATELISEKMADLLDSPESFFGREYTKAAFKEFIQKHSMVHFIPEDQSLNPVDDSFEPMLPRGCKTQQIAVFYSNQILLVDPKLWYQLPDLDKVALLVHEWVYMTLRLQGDLDSRFARRIVGKIFSEEPMEGPGQGLGSLKEYYRCSGGIQGTTRHFTFYLYDQCTEGKCEAVAQFLTFGSGIVFEKTLFKFYQPLSQLMASSASDQAQDMMIGFSNRYTKIETKNGISSITIQSAGPNGLFDAAPTVVGCEYRKQ
jgi:hypothetical protein